MATSDKAKFVLQKLLVVEQEWLTDQYVWVWEQKRWHELVVALMLQVVNREEDFIRRLVDYMVDLDLLNISDLVSVRRDISQERREQIVDLLCEQGVEPEQAERSVKLIVEAASGLQGNFGGSISRYLRYYGEAILCDISRYFQFSIIDEGKIREAFVYWLQNTLGLPVSLSHPMIKEFCERQGVSEEEIIAAADELGLNLAVLDDLILFHAKRYQTQTQDDSGR